MHHVIAAACQTGSWQQKWQCGLHNNVNVGASFADAGAKFVPVLIGIVIGLMLIAALRRKPASSS